MFYSSAKRYIYSSWTLLVTKFDQFFKQNKNTSSEPIVGLLNIFSTHFLVLLVGNRKKAFWDKYTFFIFTLHIFFLGCSGQMSAGRLCCLLVPRISGASEIKIIFINSILFFRCKLYLRSYLWIKKLCFCLVVTLKPILFYSIFLTGNTNIFLISCNFVSTKPQQHENVDWKKHFFRSFASYN